jgi:antitoxin ParD1/3/4
MSVSLPDDLQSFVEEQAVGEGYDPTAYVCELVARERDRLKLRRMLLEGAESGFGCVADEAYFESLRASLSRPLEE